MTKSRCLPHASSNTTGSAQFGKGKKDVNIPVAISSQSMYFHLPLHPCSPVRRLEPSPLTAFVGASIIANFMSCTSSEAIVSDTSSIPQDSIQIYIGPYIASCIRDKGLPHLAQAGAAVPGAVAEGSVELMLCLCFQGSLCIVCHT